jgi:uncharacterized membrane protein
MFLALKLFLIAYPLLIVLDLTWLGFLMRDVYARYLQPFGNYVDGSLIMNWPAGLLTWALLVVGLQFFVLPLVKDDSYSSAALYGAVYGLIVYGVYQLTNYAFMKDWPFNLVVIDMTWGALAHMIMAVVLVYLRSILK